MVLERSETADDDAINAKRRHSIRKTLLRVGHQSHYGSSKSFEDRALSRRHAFQVLVDFASTHEPPIDAKTQSRASLKHSINLLGIQP